MGDRKISHKYFFLQTVPNLRVVHVMATTEYNDKER